ncbi:MAG: 5'-nucleotidase [Gammaproteobacteria bacterium]|nr:5'-nucleotidase [Gammaproteobacteria bacterium]
MSYPIEKKLVIAVSSSALFNLDESDRIFRDEGAQAYKESQEKNIDKILPMGVAYPFIRRFLSFNQCFPDEQPVEVVLLSRNSTATGQRVFRSIAHYGLDISRAAFLTGESPFSYIPAFNASLFLTANAEDVRKAVEASYPAGLLLQSKVVDEPDDQGLRIAFDFDGVLADDESERVYKAEGLERFQAFEQEHQAREHNPGLLADLFRKLAGLQTLENARKKTQPDYKPILRTAIITARSAPAHERVITTLHSWGVEADETFFLGGMDKRHILNVFRPHIFFDDQLGHLQAKDLAMVHIPFGVANQRYSEAP